MCKIPPTEVFLAQFLGQLLCGPSAVSMGKPCHVPRSNGCQCPTWGRYHPTSHCLGAKRDDHPHRALSTRAARGAPGCITSLAFLRAPGFPSQTSVVSALPVAEHKAFKSLFATVCVSGTKLTSALEITLG